MSKLLTAECINADYFYVMKNVIYYIISSYYQLLQASALDVNFEENVCLFFSSKRIIQGD